MLDIGLHIEQNQNCTVTEYIMKLGKIRMSAEVLYIHRVSKIILCKVSLLFITSHPLR